PGKLTLTNCQASGNGGNDFEKVKNTTGTSGTEQSKLDGTYYIKNVHSGLYLDIENGLFANGTNLRQWGLNKYDAQKFKLVSEGNGIYHILTGASKYKSCLDVYTGSAKDGTNIAQWNYWGGDMQKFKIVKVANNKYAFLTKSSNYKSCLDLYEMSKNSGANICEWNYWGGEGQLWQLISV
ncbi:RICIN domain-containing protein, partial [Clostridium sp. SHJSY1]|uniref:RICIN domain-containing protein n=1 Tax=Clostridium sp. SHJSY1 TaxID=2942483 RepID=UPI002874221A